jgi:iron complex outermembrane recepter protein
MVTRKYHGRALKFGRLRSSTRPAPLDAPPLSLTLPQRLSPIACAVFAAIAGHTGAARAADSSADQGQLEEVVVSAEKRTENAQDVAASIQVLSSAAIENLGINSFNDYALLVPSLSFTSTGPGSAQIYFRGLSDGSVNLVETSGVQPSVAIYLDEQPVTNAGRSVDIETYDIERIEALSGPQGTLFGSGSEAGTVRIITKAPNPAAEDYGADFGYSVTEHGDPSYKVEGFANIPLGDTTAVRFVGWSDQRGGYINNVPSNFTYTFPNVTSAGFTVTNFPTVNNSLYAKNDFNTSGKEGFRLALRTIPNEHWTIDLKFVTQTLTSQGVFDVDPGLDGGDLNVARYFPDSLDDVWRQSSITTTGKFGGFELTYAGSYFDRNVTYVHDYSMYSQYSGFIAPYYNCDNSGTVLTDCRDPRMEFIGTNYIRRWDNEVRLQTPLTYPVHAIIGIFNENIEHRYTEAYDTPGLAAGDSVSATDPYTYLSFDGNRTDRQTAAFSEVTWDVTQALSLLVGGRWYDERNTINGLFLAKPLGGVFELDPRVTAAEVGNIKKFNASYKFLPSVMAYGTYSEGYRPNGVNRGTAPQDGILASYKSDFVRNYEVGIKSQWFDNRLRFNATAYHMKWTNIQFTTLVPDVIFFVSGNAGTASDDGVEFDLSFRPIDSLTLSLNGAYTDAHLTQSFCVGGPCGTAGVFWHAPSGTELAFVPKEKGAFIARYEFPWSAEVRGHAQWSTSYTGSSWSTMFLETRGPQPSYTLTNFRLGASWGKWVSELYCENLFNKDAVLFTNRSDYDFYQGGQYGRDTVARPRTVGITLSFRK